MVENKREIYFFHIDAMLRINASTFFNDISLLMGHNPFFCHEKGSDAVDSVSFVQCASIKR